VRPRVQPPHHAARLKLAPLPEVLPRRPGRVGKIRLEQPVRLRVLGRTAVRVGAHERRIGDADRLPHGRVAQVVLGHHVEVEAGPALGARRGVALDLRAAIRGGRLRVVGKESQLAGGNVLPHHDLPMMAR
jgi:hypothetical protein